MDRGNGRGRGRGARPDNPRSAYSGNGSRGAAVPIEERMGRMSLPGERGRGGARGRKTFTREEKERMRDDVSTI